MVILLGGASLSGKSAAAIKVAKKYGYEVISLDLIKMGLIRSKMTSLTPLNDDELTLFMWPMVREMIKTAVENKRNVVFEGAYIPFGYEKDFDSSYLEDIRCVFLILSERYLQNNFDAVLSHCFDAEFRGKDFTCDRQSLSEENSKILQECRRRKYSYILIEDFYRVEAEDILGL